MIALYSHNIDEMPFVTVAKEVRMGLYGFAKQILGCVAPNRKREQA